jgi:adenylate cyclase
MTEERARRKLSAILSADVQGYSRLMGDDEIATIRTLKKYREVMAVRIEQYRGRVVDAPGDNLLAEFASVVDAVECAIKIQNELEVRNTELSEDSRMQFRIGVNLGDVVEDENRIYGDGVNIAARVEKLADGGGICISGTVHDHIENKLDLEFEYIGEHAVKNIKKPVRVYRIRLESMMPESGLKGAEKTGLGTPIELPEKPSIAVLPFVNMSGDTEQEYFSDGITEDLITDLSKISALMVIARNSVFTYKGNPVKVQQVSEELGVRYVLEGSVRKAGERVRITAQLVDANTGGHLWADRYDRDLGDIFAVQDEVTQKIVTVLAVRLNEEEQKRIAKKGTDNMLAYDAFLRGLEFYNRFTKEANAQARAFFNQAVALDPTYALAYAKTGWTHLMDWTLGWTRDPRTLDLAFELAQKAQSLDENIEGCLCLLGNIYLWRKQHKKAISLFEKSVMLNSNYADGFAELGSIINFAGRSEEAVEMLEKAMRLDPLHPYNHFNIGHAYFLQKRYLEALTSLNRALEIHPEFFPARAFIAVTYAELGREDEARAEAEIILKKSPGTTLDVWRERLPYKKPTNLKRVLNGLKKAGLK